MKISICIPTYNRAILLENCIHSIIQNTSRLNADFEICISDNASTDETEKVVQRALEKISINYSKNPINIGMARNFLKVVEMAIGDYVWILGDDDLLTPNALEELNKLIIEYPHVDYFYVNSFHLATEYVYTYPHPFDTKNLPKSMEPFSTWKKHGEMKFLDLVAPEVSFDFLGGIFLSVFKRRNWVENVNVLDTNALSDPRIFANFDSTFPHVKIFAKAFANSQAYFNDRPLCVCLTGAREWAPIYPYVRSVRLVDALEEYQKNGLSYFKYLYCKNFALRYFIPDLIMMITRQGRTGLEFVNIPKLILKNCLYPNFYLSFFYYFGRKAKQLLDKTAS